ncbi:MFS transporter [Burkholderia savannae]|uniref:MFS transporter n=1 Tax=Burkholderia savannae TaxID=1637837 RepID=UPI0018DD7691|nr:MFS transporter [Burkholderia savannae]
MALTMLLMGFATNILQFVELRLLAGLAGGYSSGATIMVAVQTPRRCVAWALGVLASGVMAGNLLGPLAGAAGVDRHPRDVLGGRALIFIGFVATAVLVREAPREGTSVGDRHKRRWSQIPNKGVVLTMLGTGLLLMVANMSIEPIITVYVATVVHGAAHGSPHVTRVAGLVMAAAALGSIVSAWQLGKITDRVGHSTVIILRSWPPACC